VPILPDRHGHGRAVIEDLEPFLPVTESNLRAGLDRPAPFTGYTDVTPAWLTAALKQARTVARKAEKRLRSEKRKRTRLKEAQAHVAEELQRAQQTVTQLEQINAELHQYVADECQQITNGRSSKLE
jgi:hypothetical protein